MNDKVEIKESPEFGRYIMAKEDIKCGEIIFEEEPFVVGPKPNTICICLGCYCPVNGCNNNGNGNNTNNGNNNNNGESMSERCTKCGWPLCSDCGSQLDNPAQNHHEMECKLFVQNKVKFHNVENSDGVCMQLDCITPLRFLLQKECEPERWEAELSKMEYHAEARKNSSIWNADEINIVGYLRGPCKLKDRFSADLIQQVCGILEVNSFEARTLNGFNIRCVFPFTALMAHSCVPNTTHSILPSDNFKIKTRSSVDIPKGDNLFATYTYTLSGTMARQVHLKSGKFFTCQCKRCTDPTELDTYFSSFKCNKCDPGIISSTDPLDLEAVWKCSNCEFQTSGRGIQRALSVIQSEIDVMQDMEINAEKLLLCEKLFHKFRSVLQPNHFIQINLQQNLLEMYGRVEGYEIDELPDVVLERKLDICKHVLNILDTFEPGKTRARAMLLYEMHVPVICLAKSAYSQGVLLSGSEALRKSLQEAKDLLIEAKSILEWEDPSSSEGTLTKICQTAIDQLTDSINQIKMD